MFWFGNLVEESRSFVNPVLADIHVFFSGFIGTTPTIQDVPRMKLIWRIIGFTAIKYLCAVKNI